MCRMYGFLATAPTELECSLVDAQNALMAQSDRDRRGRRNADGWGIAQWGNTGVEVIKSTSPAFADRGFAEVAARVSSRTVMAHVRAATVGDVAERNTHPFTHGPWAFAHNGTIDTFEHVATRLDTGPFGRATGETDSELVFLRTLNTMADHGLDPEAPAQSLEPIVELLAGTVLELVDAAVRSGTGEQPKLNFLLSDGRHLAATRWGNSLYWTFRRGVSDCEVCGNSHCPSADADYRSVVIASEPITDEDWTEVPEGTVLGVEPGARTMQRDLLTPIGR